MTAAAAAGDAAINTTNIAVVVPRRAARAPQADTPVASRRLACERCVRRLVKAPSEEPECIKRQGRKKCDYCVRVGHNCVAVSISDIA